MSDSPICSRRRLLIQGGVALCGTVACGASPSGGAATEPEAFGTVSAGNVSDMTVNTLRVVDGAPAVLGRDSKGLYAMTTTCTHEGCDMVADGRITSGGVICNCHGSRFDANGNAVSGPAKDPLAHFAVTVDAAGNISVEGGSRVAASVRTIVG